MRGVAGCPLRPSRRSATTRRCALPEEAFGHHRQGAAGDGTGTTSGPAASRRLPLRLALLFLRHFRAGAPRLGQTDRDRLLAALHLAAGPSAAQRAFLALVHRALHLPARLLSVLRHGARSTYA